MKLAHKLSLVCGILCLTLASCSSDPVGRTVPVKGKVTLDGKALTLGSVAFWPNEAKGNKLPFEPGSQISADGTYELFTKGKPGAPPGSYKVTLAAQAASDSTKPSATQLVPEKFRSKDKTPLVIEVVESPAPGAYDLILK